jgi:hypothetical protein
MRGRTGGIALVAVAMAFAGCGGDDDNGSSGSGPTKAEYIAKADAICQAGDDAINTASKSLGSSPTEAEVTTFLTGTLLPNIEGQLKDLRALEPPKDDKDTINAIYDALEADVAKAKADPATLNVAGSKSPFADANAKAQAYGMKVCGKG